MSKQHFRKSIDKAVANLIKYIEKPPWDKRFAEFYEDNFTNASEELGITSDMLSETFAVTEYHNMIFGYLFEDFASCCWDNEKQSFIEDYLVRRGWREMPIARRYLQAMSDVQADLWEIVTVKSGQYADVRRYNDHSGPTFRVYEKSATQNLSRGICVAAKIIKLDGKHLFTGGILPFPPEVADTFQSIVDCNIAKNIRNAKELFTDDNIPVPENIQEIEIEYVHTQRPEILFNVWITYIYRSLNRPMPKLVNKDGDASQFSTVRFLFDPKHKAHILTCLNGQPELDYNENSNEWVWLPCSADEIPSTGVSILGQIKLTDNALELKANSTARANSGEVYLKQLLKEWVKQSLTLHESVKIGLDRQSHPPAENLPQTTPETADLNTLKQKIMDQHYRKTLDEPMPALNGQTPRKCAENLQTRDCVIRWLKDLESRANLNDSEDVFGYNFDWIWKELNLDPE